MLDVFYKDYNKGRVAGFTRVLADGGDSRFISVMLSFQLLTWFRCDCYYHPELSCSAARNGDAFCLSAFADAGRHLGSMARTLAPRLLPAVDDDAAADAAAVGSGAAPEGRNVSDLAVVCVGAWMKTRQQARSRVRDFEVMLYRQAYTCIEYLPITR